MYDKVWMDPEGKAHEIKDMGPEVNSHARAAELLAPQVGVEFQPGELSAQDALLAAGWARVWTGARENRVEVQKWNQRLMEKVQDLFMAPDRQEADIILAQDEGKKSVRMTVREFMGVGRFLELTRHRTGRRRFSAKLLRRAEFGHDMECPDGTRNMDFTLETGSPEVPDWEVSLNQKGQGPVSMTIKDPNGSHSDTYPSLAEAEKFLLKAVEYLKEDLQRKHGDRAWAMLAKVHNQVKQHFQTLA